MTSLSVYVYITSVAPQEEMVDVEHTDLIYSPKRIVSLRQNLNDSCLTQGTEEKYL